MKLHPLLNQKSPHYGRGKNASVYKMYKKYSNEKFLGWCMLNAEKYAERHGKKQGESELDNYEKYETFYYTALLVDCVIKHNNSFAKKILKGRVTKEQLILKLSKLRNQIVHTIDELILLIVLGYMERN